MASTTQARTLYAPGYTGPRFFGAPIGDFSILQTLLISFAVGVASFFAATFLGIVTILVLTESLHRKMDFSIAYRWVGLPIGIFMLVLTSSYLGWLLLKRVKNKS